MECRGYGVSGHGQFTIREKVPCDVIKRLISAEFLVEDNPDGGIWVTFEYNSFNDQIEDALGELAKYADGSIEFRDDSGDRFRYRLINRRVFYADGEVVYQKETMVRDSSLKLYRKVITETKTYEYTIRATSEKESDEMFQEWYDHHADVIDRDMANTDGERTFSRSVEIDGDPDSADIIDCQHEEW